MIKKTKILNAFSLTEVLVTMFIIMLVIIASAPMITRKNAKNKAPHGVWECYLDANGKHISKITIDSQEEKTETGGDYCTFKPQANAKNYTVMAIGGGGGGASGTAFSMDAASFGTLAGYQAPAKGDYLVLIVGGGGGGAALTKGDWKGARGGGAGGIYRTTINLNKDDYVVLEAGMGGAGGGGDADTEGGAACPTEPTGRWADACKGEDGYPSKIYVYSSNKTYTAEGGKGGSQNIGAAGSPTHGAQSAAGYRREGKIDYNNSALKDFINSDNKSAVSFGFGGKGTLNDVGEPGRPGVVMLVSNSHHAGGGGKRGTTAYTTLEKITDEVKVHVGQGGAGAITEDTNGEQGENSSFGYYVTAKGGEGGKIRYKSTSSNDPLGGEEGAISPYGDSISGGGTTMFHLNGQNDMDQNDGIAAATETQYGAGGGGGSSLPRMGSTGSSENRWGKGGRGMPGYVRVEWN